MSNFNGTEVKKTIQIRGKKGRIRIAEKRIYCKRPQHPEDPAELVVVNGLYYAVHRDADGDYVSTEEQYYGVQRVDMRIRIPQPRLRLKP